MRLPLLLWTIPIAAVCVRRPAPPVCCLPPRVIRKGCAEHVFAAGFPPLKELLDNYLEMGGQLLVCGPCVQARQIDAAEFVEGATIVSAATFVAQISEANNVLVY